jgi:hypothetical protein
MERRVTPGLSTLKREGARRAKNLILRSGDFVASRRM